MNGFTIGKLAKASGISVDSLRYYERLELLNPQSRSRAGYRMYSESDVQRIRFIKRCQGLGFSLMEIKRLLEFGTSEDATAADVLELTESKIAEQKEKISALRRIRRALTKVAQHCPGEGPVEQCPIFKFLNTSP